jgi:stress-induced morphogen
MAEIVETEQIASETTEEVDGSESGILTTDALQTKIMANIENVEHISVVDDSDGCGAKFTVLVVSSAFQGKAILARHRMVCSAFHCEHFIRLCAELFFFCTTGKFSSGGRNETNSRFEHQDYDS